MAKEKGQPESCPENTLCVLSVLHTNFINKFGGRVLAYVTAIYCPSVLAIIKSIAYTSENKEIILQTPHFEKPPSDQLPIILLVMFTTNESISVGPHILLFGLYVHSTKKESRPARGILLKDSSIAL